MTKLNIKPLAASILFTAAVAPAMSQAATSFNALVESDGVYVNTAQDGSGEFAVRKVGDVYLPVTKDNFSGDDLKLKVGDLFGGVFFMDSLNGANIGSGSSYTGFAGFYLTEITSISNIGTKDIVGNTIAVADFLFAPPSDTSAWQAIFGVNVLGGYYNFGTLNNNTALVITQDKNQSFTISDFASVPGAITEAIGSPDELWATLGFDPADSDHFWNGTQAPLIPQDIIDLWPTYAGSKIGEYGYGLDVLDNNTPFTFKNRFPTKDYEFYATAGNLYIPNQANQFTIENDAKATFLAVPEPATLGLLGLGLLGMGFALRKRQA